MAATAEQKTELEKICADLETKIAAQTTRLAEELKAHKANLDAAAGDARLVKEALEKEVIELGIKRDGLQNTITAGLAGINAEKIAQASSAEALNTEKIRLEKVKDDLNAAQTAFAAVKEEYQIRANKLTADLEQLTKDRQEIDKRLLTAQATVDQANKDHAEAQKMAGEAAALFLEGKEKIQTADNHAKEILAQANKTLEEAKTLSVLAAETKAQAEANMKTANDLKIEYTKKLEESQDFAMKNSALADKLCVWEASLYVEKQRLQDDRAKVTQAEKDYSAKNKGVIK